MRNYFNQQIPKKITIEELLILFVKIFKGHEKKKVEALRIVETENGSDCKLQVILTK